MAALKIKVFANNAPWQVSVYAVTKLQMIGRCGGRGQKGRGEEEGKGERDSIVSVSCPPTGLSKPKHPSRPWPLGTRAAAGAEPEHLASQAPARATAPGPLFPHLRFPPVPLSGRTRRQLPLAERTGDRRFSQRHQRRKKPLRSGVRGERGWRGGSREAVRQATMEPSQQRLSQAIHGHGSYDSDFSDDENCGEPKKRKRKINEDSLLKKPFQKEKHAKMPHRYVAAEELDREEARNRRFHLIAMNAYERHKKLVNDYILYYGGKKEDFRRSGENDKTDLDVIRENHRFLWNEEDEMNMTWEKRLAKKYYDKLFKEYCIADLSRYKDNQFGFRWRIEKEVVSGKGQFFCGNKRCDEKEGLKSWEVNFGYIEHGEKRNALVKLRLCQKCSFRLNFHHRRKEVKPKKKRDRTEKDCEESSHNKSTLSSSNTQTSKKKKGKERSPSEKSERSDNENSDGEEGTSESELWKGPLQETDEKSQEEEFDEYFQDLFL